VAAWGDNDLPAAAAASSRRAYCCQCCHTCKVKACIPLMLLLLLGC
jgi:hypothetical protein